jgi:hypothetical protein
MGSCCYLRQSLQQVATVELGGAETDRQLAIEREKEAKPE